MAVLLKLDITKAFDSLHWAFLIDVLQKLGFGGKWIEWISAILSTASTKVLMNGFPGRCISHRRGLRQGDPLSPMLFVLAMDVLNYLLDCSTEAGVLEDCGLRRRTSIFADDVLATFILPTCQDLQACMAVLADFGEASGLVVNLSKSAAHPIRCSGAQRQLFKMNSTARLLISLVLILDYLWDLSRRLRSA